MGRSKFSGAPSRRHAEHSCFRGRQELVRSDRVLAYRAHFRSWASGRLWPTVPRIERAAVPVKQVESKQMKNSDHESSMINSTERVRQGVTGHNVRYVLIFSLLGLLIAFVIVAVFAS